METKSFQVHSSILYSIIKSQAGSLSKALLEGVMNSIDAGATRCALKVDNTSFSVKDDGKGFTSKEEVDNFFGTFGHPHTEGDATYGRFRMGRGQMFAFARNTWRTGTFQMEVDIKEKGLDYSLQSKLAAVKGCSIHGDLYDELPSWQLQEILTDLKKLLMFAQIPVTLNGTLISKDPSTQKWDLETDDAYIKLSGARDLAVYNLGVHVRDFWAGQMGSGGVMVSKRALAVNFARNDILTHTCKVWQRTREKIREMAGLKVARKKSLTPEEREFLAKQFASRESACDWNEWSEVRKVALIPTAAGRNAPLSQVLDSRVIVLAPSTHKRLGDHLHRSGTAFCITEEGLSRFNCSTVQEFLAVIARNAPYLRVELPVEGDFNELTKGISAGFTTVLPPEQSALETTALSALQAAQAKYIAPWLRKLTPEIGSRMLQIGASDEALAWTDGKHSIHLERKFLAKHAKEGLDGWFRIMMVLLHEYCHEEQDLDDHPHDQNFFELYEDLATGRGCPMATAAAYASSTFNAKILSEGTARLGKKAFGAEQLLKGLRQDDDEPKAPRQKAKASEVRVLKGQLALALD